MSSNADAMRVRHDGHFVWLGAQEDVVAAFERLAMSAGATTRLVRWRSGPLKVDLRGSANT